MRRCSQRVIKSRHKRASAGRSLIEKELVFSQGGVGGAGVRSSRIPLDCRTDKWGRRWFWEPARPPATSHQSYEDTLQIGITHPFLSASLIEWSVKSWAALVAFICKDQETPSESCANSQAINGHNRFGFVLQRTANNAPISNNTFSEVLHVDDVPCFIYFIFFFSSSSMCAVSFIYSCERCTAPCTGKSKGHRSPICSF